jgi:hypothetical protein
MKIRRSVLSGAYWVILLFSLLSYGANAALSLSLASTAAFALVIVAYLVEGEPATTGRPFWIAFSLFGIVAIWAWVQTLPWSSGAEAAIWRNVASLSPNALPGGSVSSGDAVLGLLKMALPICVLMTGLILFNREDRAMRALKVLAVGGGILAALALLQFLLLPQYLLFEPKLFYRNSLTGPFVNRNTAGTFFGVVSILLFSLTWRAATKIDLHGLAALLEPGRRMAQPRETMVAAGFGCLFLVALSAELLTNSRAAIALTVLSLLSLSLLLAFRPRHRAKRRASHLARGEVIRRSLTAGALVVIALMIVSGLSARVQLRFEEAGSVDPRFCALGSIWSAAMDFWPKGAGLTSFQVVFPAYRDPACGTAGVWDKAHNVYLEGVFSLGIVFPITLAIAVIEMVRIFRRGFRRRKSRYYVVATGACITMMVGLHAALDFSLQIPGFAAYFAALLSPFITICLRKTKTDGASFEVPSA